MSIVDVTVPVTENELKLLRAVLRVSNARPKDPIKFIKSQALIGALSFADSTVAPSDFPRLKKLAKSLGLDSAAYL